MWVMTTGGFVSAVAHRENKSMLMVRGRDKKSLENMLQSIVDGLARAGQPALDPLPEVQSQPKGVHWDYPHRVIVSKVHFEYFLIDEVEEYLDYANFKSEATVARGKEYHDALMNVWTDMKKLTEPEFRPSYSYHGGSTVYKPWSPGDYAKKTGEGSEAGGDGAKGSIYTWDDETGALKSKTPLYDDIHSLPLDVDPTAADYDDIVDVDADGAPIHGRSSLVVDLGEQTDDELNELDEVLLAAGFHLDDERDADELDADDSIYRVNLTKDDEDDDARFQAWLARRDRDDAIAAAQDTGAFREPEEPAEPTRG